MANSLDTFFSAWDMDSDVDRAAANASAYATDGKEMVQHGQYFVDLDGDKISPMVGFVGTGAPE